MGLFSVVLNGCCSDGFEEVQFSRHRLSFQGIIEVFQEVDNLGPNKGIACRDKKEKVKKQDFRPRWRLR